MDALRVARRIVAWAPDQARDLVATLTPDTDADHADATFVMALSFSVTRTWDLARRAFEQAAAICDTFDAARALEARALANALPLEPFASERDAMFAELDLVARCVRGEPVTLRRTLVDIRRALPPRRITGQLEATFRLGPGEVAVIVAALASTAGLVDAPLRTIAEWQDQLGIRLHGDDALERLRVLVTETPFAVPRPAVASRLLGRTTIEQPRGIRLELVPADSRAPRGADALAASLARGGIGVIHGEPSSGRRTLAANIAHAVVFAIRRTGNSPDLDAALLEVGLHDAVPLIDLDEWHEPEVFMRDGRLIAIARENPSIPNARRAFTIHTWRDE